MFGFVVFIFHSEISCSRRKSGACVTLLEECNHDLSLTLPLVLCLRPKTILTVALKYHYQCSFNML